MTRYTREMIYELLPAIYRQRDIENGQPLKDLLDLVSDQVEYIEEDIGKLYNNWFVETCEEWAISYIAELVGAKNQLYPLSSSSESSRNIPSLRSFVANRIRYVNRKGTVLTLEQVARDVTGWPAVAYEFFKSLTTTQNLNHLRLENKATVDLNNLNSLDLVDTPPFDTLTHTVDVRRITSNDDDPRYYNIPNIGIFLWRLRALPVIDAPALNLGNGLYSFSPIGIDIPLYNNPLPLEGEFSHTGEINVSCPIRRLAFEYNLASYYATDGSRSIKVEVDGVTKNVEDVIVLDLSDWKKDNREKEKHHHIPRGKIGIDPVLGRILLSLEEAKEGTAKVYVSYYYGFSSELGGGFYPRPRPKSIHDYNNSNNNENNRLDNVDNESVYKEPVKYLISQKKRVDGNNNNNIIYASISEAIKKWSESHESHKNIVFEIMDSEFYDESVELILQDQGVYVKLCSSQLQRPHIRGNIIISADKNDCSVTLDGLHIDKSHYANDNNNYDDDNKEEFEDHEKNPLVKIDEKGHLANLTISHCTMIPRRNKSIVVKSGNNGLLVTLDHSICGRIDMYKKSETRLRIIESIIEGKGIDKAEDGKMIYNNEHILHDNILTCYEIELAKNSTIFGKINSVLIRLANNSIFTDLVNVEQKQIGCMRNCYIPIGSNVPRKYHCQPKEDNDDDVDEDEEQTESKKDMQARNNSSVVISTRFTSDRYGDPGYAQLHNKIPTEISRGADNDSEMGVFNELRQYQRINILGLLLRDFLRFGMEVGIFCAT